MRGGSRSESGGHDCQVSRKEGTCRPILPPPSIHAKTTFTGQTCLKLGFAILSPRRQAHLSHALPIGTANEHAGLCRPMQRGFEICARSYPLYPFPRDGFDTVIDASRRRQGTAALRYCGAEARGKEDRCARHIPSHSSSLGELRGRVRANAKVHGRIYLSNGERLQHHRGNECSPGLCSFPDSTPVKGLASDMQGSYLVSSDPHEIHARCTIHTPVHPSAHILLFWVPDHLTGPHCVSPRSTVQIPISRKLFLRRPPYLVTSRNVPKRRLKQSDPPNLKHASFRGHTFMTSP